jgi:septation ring formation regulator EzrA
MLGYNSLKGYGSVWRGLKDEVKQRKEEHLVKIKELNDALGIARAKLSLEKEYEEKLNELHSQYDEVLNGASGALSRFEETLAQGSSCLESINKAIEETGSLVDSELPIGLREQLKFVESCMIEGVEENDE